MGEAGPDFEGLFSIIRQNGLFCLKCKDGRDQIPCFSVFFALARHPNIRQNDELQKAPRFDRNQPPDCRHQGQPERGPRPVPAPAHVPARAAGVRGLWVENVPGGH